MKHLLTIAGSDSSGGAGIQADLKTFAAHGTFGMSVITAVTAQNTCGVTLIQELLPLATLVTPNMPEAEAICGFPITSEKEMTVAAQRIVEPGAKAVMVKGCRLMNDQSNDYLYDGTKGTWLSGTRIETKNTHGTGCTLSSALAANLANGMSIEEAARSSKAYVTKAIAHSLPLGNGCGPTHHFVDLYEKSGLLQP